MADTSAVEDDAVREHRPLALREEVADDGLDLLRVRLVRPLPAPHEPPEVRVHGDARHSERIAQDDIRGLATDAGQRDQVLQAARHLAAEVVAQGRGQAEQRFRLGPEETRGPDQLLQRLGVRRRHVLRRRVGGEEGGGGLVDPQVGGLSRENRGDQQLEAVLEVELGVGVGIDLGELAVDPARPAHQREPRLARARLATPALGRFAAVSRSRLLLGRTFAQGGIAWRGRPPRPLVGGTSGPLPLCSHRRIGHSARLKPSTDIRPDRSKSAAQSDPCRTVRDTGASNL